MTDEVWNTERLHDHFAQSLRVSEMYYDSKTEHQRLKVFQNGTFGRVLTLDDVVQTTEGDNFIYHEMLTHVPVLAHGNASDICIIGGGDGGILREALKHPVDRVTMVEIDPSVIALCRQHLPSISAGAFDDPRADVVIADGARFIAETDLRFDVIIVDSTDPMGPGEVLFTSEFYGACKARLTDGGVIVTQSGVAMIQGGELTTTVRRLGKHFADANAYIAPIPTYVGGFMALGWGTDNTALRDLSPGQLAKRFHEADITTRYYNADLHGGAFALPTYIANLVEAAR